MTKSWRQCLIFLVFTLNECLGFEKYYDGHVVLQVIPKNSLQFEALRKLNEALGFEFDFWKHSSRVDKPADIMIPEEKLDEVQGYLKKNNLDAKTKVIDVGRLIRKEEEILESHESSSRLRSMPSFNLYDYHTYDDQMAYIKSIAQQYSYVHLESLGKSVEGRDIQYLKIGYPSNRFKNILFIDAGIHAREWIAPATAICIIDRLVTNPDYTSLLYDIDIYVVPNVNPDGYEYSRTSDRMWRKNRSGPRQGCYGVDLNRNFAFKWGYSGISRDPCSETYAGSSALSEVEARHLAKILDANNNTIKAYVTLHSYGEDLIYPWGYAIRTYPSDVADLKKLAHEAAEAIHAVNGTQYSVGNSADELYPASGASDDYSKSIGIKFVYTFELSPTSSDDNFYGYGFQFPKEFIQPTCEETFPGILTIAKAVQDTSSK